MAIEKMEMVSLVGPLEDFVRIAGQYLVNGDIHLENVFDVLDNPKDVYPFPAENPQVALLKGVEDVLLSMGIDSSKIPETEGEMTPEEIKETVKRIDESLKSVTEDKNHHEEKLKENEEIIRQLTHIKEFDVQLSELFEMKFVYVRFGSMPREQYEHLDRYLNDYSTFFFKYDEDREYVYGMYLVPAAMKEKVDTIFSSLYFHKTRISDKADGTPKEEYTHLTEENQELSQKIKAIDEQVVKIREKEEANLFIAYKNAEKLYNAYGIRKFAGHTKNSFYLAGWMPEREVSAFKNLLMKEKNVTVFTEKAKFISHLSPPTKLRNFPLFRPFEGYVKMYGLPNYNETDPTPIFAITYSLMFGMMYGDVGHGLVLALIGFILARKKNFLGHILEICGLSAIIFGFLYGSIFGYEDIIKPLWYSPMHNMMSTLIIAVGLGAVIITASMVINIINGVKKKDVGRILLSPNGIAGFVFYWAVIVGALSIVMGNSIIKGWYIALFVVLPLILLFFKEPLTHLIERKKEIMPKDKGGFFLETFFEMFEVLLSYVTNTISFIRVGAFALNHAGMMAVVFTLSEMASGSSAVLVIVLGNLLVLGLEGLLAAIQVLRLQFYEMFSRYYDGSGKAFEKYKAE